VGGGAVRRTGPLGARGGVRGHPVRRVPAPRGRPAGLGERGDEGGGEVLPGLVEPHLGPVRGAGQGLRGDRRRGGRATVRRPVRPAGQRRWRGLWGFGGGWGLVLRLAVAAGGPRWGEPRGPGRAWRWGW